VTVSKVAANGSINSLLKSAAAILARIIHAARETHNNVSIEAQP